MKALFYLFVIGVSIVGTAKAERYMVCGGRNAVQCESGMTCEYIQGADYGYCRTENRPKQISCLSKERFGNVYFHLRANKNEVDSNKYDVKTYWIQRTGRYSHSKTLIDEFKALNYRNSADEAVLENDQDGLGHFSVRLEIDKNREFRNRFDSYFLEFRGDASREVEMKCSLRF